MPQLSRTDVIAKVTAYLYGGGIVNNAHRGDIAEMIVLSALSEEWRSVGLGWYPWDLQRGSGGERVRIQVKHCAALQIWGPTKRMTVNFGWKKAAPLDFESHHSGVEIESEGWFRDLFVFGLHLEMNADRADQVDPAQWQLLVVPVTDLNAGQNSMVLNKAMERWPVVSYQELPRAVAKAVLQMKQALLKSGKSTS